MEPRLEETIGRVRDRKRFRELDRCVKYTNSISRSWNSPTVGAGRRRRPGARAVVANVLGIEPRTGTVALEGARSRRVVNDDWASRSGSGSPSVLVDENADDIMTFDLAHGFA